MRCLVTRIDSSGLSGVDIKQRCDKTRDCKSWSMNVTLDSKRLAYNAVIERILLYGAKAWFVPC